ncbi:DUF4244 domain-containing protein [Tessaracoccus flavus]|jgi:hypothetical protein|uniref:Uncharacterized protein n=1 Tax=Tessaracoccus flavus TaxID=1610493 RepID=A0A1Q2CC16_9ACTN|nr:DUF4244 domain-containing protein [Tessaracoccus flavus]AQP43640.1 hypothetical protein RPIT_01425 [Tessaracoccus flavus]SDZ01557.1 Protein of unknown function [Tessaracoccus flavus]
MHHLVPLAHRARAAQLSTRLLAQRGLTTVEYAIGLLGAATAALLLLRIFNDNRLFETLFNNVISIFARMVKGNG